MCLCVQRLSAGLAVSVSFCRFRILALVALAGQGLTPFVIRDVNGLPCRRGLGGDEAV